MAVSRLSAFLLTSAIVLGLSSSASAETKGSPYKAARSAPVSSSASSAPLKPISKSGGWQTAKGPLTGNERSIPLGGGYRAHFGIPVKAALVQGTRSAGQETTNRTVGISRGMKVDTYNGSTTPSKGVAISSSKTSFSTYGRNVNTTRTTTMGSSTKVAHSTMTR